MGGSVGSFFYDFKCLKDALYYMNEQEVTGLINNIEQLQQEHRERFIEGELKDICENYSWEHLVDQHEEYFKWLMEDGRKNATNAK